MKREDIERAAIECGVIGRSIYNEEYQPYYMDGFADGADWRINSVWHRADEKPCVGRNIEVLFENGNTTTWFPTSEIIEDFQKFNVKMWAYIEDLLPDAE